MNDWNGSFNSGALGAHLTHLAIAIMPVTSAANFASGLARRMSIVPAEAEQLNEAADRLEAAAAVLRAATRSNYLPEWREREAVQ